MRSLGAARHRSDCTSNAKQEWGGIALSGLFGAINCNAELSDAFRRECIAIWPTASIAAPAPGCLLGSQGFGEHRGLYQSEHGEYVAVDGEAHLFRHSTNAAAVVERFNGANSGYRAKGGVAGNIASIDAHGNCAVYCHDSGLFPLYYAKSGDSYLFASQVRPLARMLRHAELDHHGILQFLGEGYNFAGRTVFQNVKRFLPGQRAIGNHDGHVSYRETSTLWTEATDEPTTGESAADRFWESLTEATADDLSLHQGDLTLMMSAGWDSRTLLAAYLDCSNEHKPHAYFHGDAASREHQIVERICDDHEVPLQAGGLDDQLWSIDFLRRAFDHTENLIFPHWHRAGDAISGHGPISAGIFGEVPGGHYGTAQLGSNTNRVWSVASKLFNPVVDHSIDAEGLERARNSLLWSDRMFYWYVNEEFRAESRPGFQSATNTDIESELDRLLKRGIPTIEQLVEAFTSEHRGAFYVGAQLLSAGHNRGISAPFARSKVLQQSTRLPLTTKVHNRLNRQILKEHSPRFIDYPSAATLVALKRPLIIQEASRAARKLYETGKTKAYRLTGGSVTKAHIEWVNFDFLVERPELIHQLVDDLEADIWDIPAMRSMADNISAGNLPESDHQIYDQFNKIYTIDAILRGARASSPA
jgi:hypothetical protein